jgi:hypothetical protein
MVRKGYRLRKDDTEKSVVYSAKKKNEFKDKYLK